MPFELKRALRNAAPISSNPLSKLARLRHLHDHHHRPELQQEGLKALCQDMLAAQQQQAAANDRHSTRFLNNSFARHRYPMRPQ
jgi:hypothetical protein